MKKQESRIRGKKRWMLSQVAAAIVLSSCSQLDLFEPSKGFTTEKSKSDLVFNINAEVGPKGVKPEYRADFPSAMSQYKLPAPKLEVNHEVRRELNTYLRNNAKCIKTGLENL